MSIDTERLKILNEMKELQNRLDILNKESFTKEKDINISTKNIDFLFGLAHLHESDYESYVFLENFIKYSLKERIINLKKELAVISAHKEHLSKVLDNPELNKHEYSLSTEKIDMELLLIREKDIANKLQDIRTALAQHEIYPKNEPFFKDENDRIRLEKWVKMKRAKSDFECFNKTDEELNNQITLLKLEIEKNKRKMDEVIAE